MPVHKFYTDHTSTGCDVYDYGDVDFNPSHEEEPVKNVRNMKDVINFNEKVRIRNKQLDMCCFILIIN